MPAFDVAGARKAGYDDKEILSYVAGEENPDLLPGTDAEKIRLLLARNGKHMLDVEYLSPTQLEPMQEVQFQDWAKRNQVRLEPGWNEDYDMRGLWKANPGAAPDERGHWPDTYKLPNHPTFSSQSVYALPDSPRWYGKRLIDSQGKVIADESNSPLDLPDLPAPKLPQGLGGPPASVPGSVPQTGERRNMSPREIRSLYSEQGIQPTLPPTSLLDMAMLATSGPEQDAGIPLSLLGMVKAAHPWQVRKAELIGHSATLPRRKTLADLAGGYSEAEMHERALRNRASETMPPEITHHDVGSWGIDSSGELMHLREYDLDDPRLIFTEGRPRNQTTQKYVDWIQQGHEPPPLTAVETEKGNIKIQEGHHRSAALRDTGRKKAKVWVSVTHNRPIGEGQVMPEGVTHKAAIERALAEGKSIPPDVLEDYLDLVKSK